MQLRREVVRPVSRRSRWTCVLALTGLSGLLLANATSGPRFDSGHYWTISKMRAIAVAIVEADEGCDPELHLPGYGKQALGDLRDPWGRPYLVECGEHILVVSKGKDGELGTDDDLVFGL
jgi:hypothetical protein